MYLTRMELNTKNMDTIRLWAHRRKSMDLSKVDFQEKEKKSVET